jgi:8-oxo-dGTP diphosphatase
MRYRIRAAVLIVENDRILLVHHVDPKTGESFWVPPGGGLEDSDESIFQCADRETFEETGLSVTTSRIAYIREFCDHSTSTHHLEIFLLADTVSGTLTLARLPSDQPDSDMIKDVKWIGREETPFLTVYPEVLRIEFWTHLESGFAQTHYLGRQTREIQ